MPEDVEFHVCPDCDFWSPYAPHVPVADRVCLRCASEVPAEDDPELELDE